MNVDDRRKNIKQDSAYPCAETKQKAKKSLFKRIDAHSLDKSKKKKKKKDEKPKKSKKSKKHKRRHHSSSSDTESNEELPRKRKMKTHNAAAEHAERAANVEPLQRDSWMSEVPMFKTFVRNNENKNVKETQKVEVYDPTKSARELNPHWKTTGTGLPTFQKPNSDSDVDEVATSARRADFSARKKWRKESAKSEQRHRKHSNSAEKDMVNDAVIETKNVESPVDLLLSDQQMNELAAKIVKAEILGNHDMAKQLQEKLEKARNMRLQHKDLLQTQQSSARNKYTQKDVERHVVTLTDKQGNVRPLLEMEADRKQHKKKQKTHYFAEDDKYDIKQMFERERCTSAADANLQFANMASEQQNLNDDMSDIFADRALESMTQGATADKQRQRAIQQYERQTQQLESCEHCLDSKKMNKNLLVCHGEKVHLSLPWHVGLQTGHCIITPNQHVNCCTQLDEDTWAEINDFRKAIVRMFAAQRKDVIFYEIANKLQRKPHLSIHCVPIQESQGEMAPFYFKKAIEECEHEWSVNKQLVSLRQKGLRQSIPKGLPYFWVNFGMDSGFAHVIEDEHRFPSNFAMEIIGGMLHLNANVWRKPQKEQNIIAKVKQFEDWWRKYDCTNKRENSY